MQVAATRPQRHYGKIRALDTGVCIVYEDVIQVFDRFFNSQAAPTGGGSGSSLVIAKRVMNLRCEHTEIGSAGINRNATITVAMSLFTVLDKADVDA